MIDQETNQKGRKLAEVLDSLAGGRRWKLRRRTTEDEGVILTAIVDDVELDQFRVTFDRHEKTVQIDTDAVSYVMFSPYDLRRLASLAEHAFEVGERWEKTRAGQAWSALLEASWFDDPIGYERLRQRFLKLAGIKDMPASTNHDPQAPSLPTIASLAELDAPVLAEALESLLADDEMCLRLAEGYDREDAAQRGEPSPHTMGEDGHAEWAADRVACAREGLRAAIGAMKGRGHA